MSVGSRRSAWPEAGRSAGHRDRITGGGQGQPSSGEAVGPATCCGARTWRDGPRGSGTGSTCLVRTLLPSLDGSLSTTSPRRAPSQPRRRVVAGGSDPA